MTGRIVEIAEDGRHLSALRGFLVVAERGTELGRVPLDDLAAVIANAHGLTYSNNLLVPLAPSSRWPARCESATRKMSKHRWRGWSPPDTRG